MSDIRREDTGPRMSQMVVHGDTIYLMPQLDQMHKFDAQGLRIE